MSKNGVNEKRYDLLGVTFDYAKDRDYKVRRTAVDLNVPVVLDANLTYAWAKENEFGIKELSEYYRGRKESLVNL